MFWMEKKKSPFIKKYFATIIGLWGNHSNVISTFPAMVIACLLYEGGECSSPHMFGKECLSLLCADSAVSHLALPLTPLPPQVL